MTKPMLSHSLLSAFSCIADSFSPSSWIFTDDVFFSSVVIQLIVACRPRQGCYQFLCPRKVYWRAIFYDCKYRSSRASALIRLASVSLDAWPSVVSFSLANVALPHVAVSEIARKEFSQVHLSPGDAFLVLFLIASKHFFLRSSLLRWEREYRLCDRFESGRKSNEYSPAQTRRSLLILALDYRWLASYSFVRIRMRYYRNRTQISDVLSLSFPFHC